MSLFKDYRFATEVLENAYNLCGFALKSEKHDREVFEHAIDVYNEGGFIPNLSQIWNELALKKINEALHVKYPFLTFVDSYGTGSEIDIRVSGTNKSQLNGVSTYFPVDFVVKTNKEWLRWIEDIKKGLEDEKNRDSGESI